MDIHYEYMGHEKKITLITTIKDEFINHVNFLMKKGFKGTIIAESCGIDYFRFKNIRTGTAAKQQELINLLSKYHPILFPNDLTTFNEPPPIYQALPEKVEILEGKVTRLEKLVELMIKEQREKKH